MRRGVDAAAISNSDTTVNDSNPSEDLQYGFEAFKLRTEPHNLPFRLILLTILNKGGIKNLALWPRNKRSGEGARLLWMLGRKEPKKCSMEAR